MDDLWFEKDEAFGLRLSNPTNGATLGKRSTEWVEIASDDAKQPGRFQFSSPTYTVFEGQLAAMLTVVRVDGDSAAAGEHLLRTQGVLVLVDGYNVAMLGWPRLHLHQQRDQCVQAAETIARRWGTDVHVVFDGAEVVGTPESGPCTTGSKPSPDGCGPIVTMASTPSTRPASRSSSMSRNGST